MMREKLVCRFCDSQTGSGQLAYTDQNSGAGLLQSGRMGGRKSFAILGSSPHYAPDRPFKVEHILLDLKVDPKAQTLAGVVTQDVRVIAPNQHSLKLDQIDLQIEAVQINNREAEFSREGHSLQIQFHEAPRVGDILSVAVQYRVQNPRRGIYFTGPDADHPKKPYQVWTQGQDEDSRYWFPTLDYPNQKATSEVVVSVPRGFTAVSNGALISKNEVEGGVQFHYRLGTPHVTYLITLVVGEFSEWSDSGPHGVPVQYFVARELEADGKRAFGNTPKMIEAFEKKTGVAYPFEKYSQVAVQDFIFGGMENTSATTQTDLTLHDERAHLDFSSDPLVSHELAHQWFGDLLTCRDWSHGWLNEGFATFMERVWVESNPGEGGGFEEAKYYSYQDLKEHFAEDQGKYRRPIVCNTYIEPIDLFDTHLYQKGGLVLHFIRYVLGEDAFWKSVNVYVNRHRGQNVETLDLIRAIEDTTGRNLRRIFDEWIFNAGYPEFEVSYQWHEDKKLTEWIIEQKQTQGAPNLTQDGVTTPLFHLPVVLELTRATGEKITHRIEIGELRERIFLPSPDKPVLVRFDPDFSIPKTLKFPRSKELLLAQLEKDADCMGRIEAAQELSKMPDPDVIIALGKGLREDSFWGVQVEIAQVLAGIKTAQARDQLITGLQVKNPKARRAIATALGSFRDRVGSDALKPLAVQDESYFVEAEAIRAWAVSRYLPQFDSETSDYQGVEEFLIQQLKKSSYRDVIRSAALSALAELPGIGTGKFPQALDTLIQWTQRGLGIDVRMAAVRGLGRVFQSAGKVEQARLIRVFQQLSEEDNFRLRMQMVSVLENTGQPEFIPILDRIRQADTDGRVKRGAQNAIGSLRESGGVPQTVSTLKTSIEKLEEDFRKLRSMMEDHSTQHGVV